MGRQLGAVLVVGGGIAGMSAALQLRPLADRVTLIDLDPQWRVYGAGITLTGPSLRALRALGVLDQVMAQGAFCQSTLICDPAGNLLLTLPTPGFDDGAVPGAGGILRPDLHAILSAQVRQADITVRLGMTVERFTQHEDAVEVVFSDGSSGRFALVVGADGMNSRLRGLVFPDAAIPRYTGQGVFRLLAPRPAEMSEITMFVGAHAKVGVTPVSAAQMYLFSLIDLPDNPRLPDADLPGLLRHHLRGFGGIVAEIRENATVYDSIVYRPLFQLLLPDPWYRGRVVLIGDAAHATTPHLASGAGIAIEDALVLAEEIAAAASLDAALASFMARRFARCRMVVENSVRLGEMEMQHAPPSEHSALMHQSLAALAAAI